MPGDFAGEMSTLRGTPGFARVEVSEAGEVLVITDSDLRVVVQTDASFSEIFMRAFILRRMGLIASPNSAMTLIGSRYCGHVDVARVPVPECASRISISTLRRMQEAAGCYSDGRAHRLATFLPSSAVGRAHGGSLRQLAEFLEINPEIDPERDLHDVLVVGAGPAGLARRGVRRVRKVWMCE